MSDLAEFLLARFAEDEAEARNAAAAIGDGEWFGSPANLRRVFSVTMTEVARSAVPRHIARHDPARVLAECEAKRRVVEHHGSNGDDWPLCVICTEVGPDAQGWPCLTLRALALPYADHPEFREEWKP